MTSVVALIVLSAAFLHALWNAMVKGAGDRVIMLGMIALGHVVFGLVILAFADAPDPSAWPFLAASVAIHWLYFYFLNVAYRLGDLSFIYPVARGFAPVLVALGAQFWAGEVLPPLAWMGIVCVSAGIMLLSHGALRSNMPIAALWAALAIGCTVVAYTLVDGFGVRTSQSAFGYIGWLFVTKIIIVIFLFPSRMDRLRAQSIRTLLIGFVGGVVSGTAYALVLYAKTIAPLGLVSALRETSVIFAAMIGVIWLGEGPKTRRLVSAGVVGAGIIFIGLTRTV